jgi:hypothetical protein
MEDWLYKAIMEQWADEEEEKDEKYGYIGEVISGCEEENNN